MEYIIYKELFTEEGFERYYYSATDDRNRANEMAMSIAGGCVCEASEAREFGIQYLPLWVK